MAWLTSSATSSIDLDNKISQATSESIPNGDLDLPLALEITDLIRSKKVPPQQCMRSLKKRLTLVYSNPNVLTSTLKLIDVCVKNSGYDFLVEISSREFIDYMIDFLFKLHYNTKDPDVRNDPARLGVGTVILHLVQTWKIAFENQLQLGYVETVYNQLVRDNYEFLTCADEERLNFDFHVNVNSKFVDSQVAPDWIDNDSCMICYNAFSMINRKHHCRSCGGVFCNDHSLSRIPLVGLGIMDPVRVCDNCFTKHTKASVKSGTTLEVRGSKSRSMLGAAAPGDDDEDEELKRAIELSLQDSQGFAISPEFRDQGPKSQQPPPSTDENDENDEEDDEMKAAIAASLKEYQQQETIKQQQQQQHQQFNQQSVGQLNQPSEPESDFYNISIPQYQPYPSDQFNQQQIQPGQQYQQYNETGPQPQYPPPPAPQQPPKVEDLSQQEEENINLFITLMNSIKNDRKKRANILYDSDLNELHAKVITLKPKVNKSLRLAIEKYEAFLELNNKISTVSKLYDEFLESKLSMAYNNQSLASTQHTGGPNYFQSASQANQYGGFVEDQSTGVSQTYSNPQYSNDQFVGQQNSGYNQRYDYQSNVNPQNLNPPGSNPQLANHSVINPQYTASSTTEKRRSQYDTESSMKQPATTFNQPSEPLYGQDNEQSNYSYSSQPRYDEIPELTPEDSDKEYLSKIPINYTNEVDEQTIPYPPVSPPLNNADNTDLQASLPATTNTVRRQSSTLPPHALEEANAKYPALENDDQYTSEPIESTFSDMSKFPQVPTTIDAESIASSKSKFIPEPEPLIEL